jgi:hypothetical protein
MAIRERFRFVYHGVLRKCVTDSPQPQTQVLPLKFPVKVFSGIAPPAALLESASARPPPIPHRPSTTANMPDPAYPPQLGTPAAAFGDEPPPSYEDAMAEDIAPVDGPRREYSGVTDENGPSEVDNTPGRQNTVRRGEKGGFSDRLFPNAGPGPRPGSGNGYIK